MRLSSSLLLRMLLSAAVFLALYCDSSAQAMAQANAQATSQTSAQSTAAQSGETSNAPSAQDTAAAKAAERRKHFEELKKQLESDNPHSKEPSSGASSASQATSPASSNELALSPILVNMLVGETQRFSLFDFAGHKLTAQAEWSIDDTSVAELTVVDGVPTLVSKQTGTVRLRARADGRSAEATINVITPEEMKPGTVRWQAPPVPGFKPVKIVPAVPTGPSS